MPTKVSGGAFRDLMTKGVGLGGNQDYPTTVEKHHSNVILLHRASTQKFPTFSLERNTFREISAVQRAHGLTRVSHDGGYTFSNGVGWIGGAGHRLGDRFLD